jgi:hypothetical protein
MISGHQTADAVYPQLNSQLCSQNLSRTPRPFNFDGRNSAFSKEWPRKHKSLLKPIRDDSNMEGLDSLEGLLQKYVNVTRRRQHSSPKNSDVFNYAEPFIRIQHLHGELFLSHALETGDIGKLNQKPQQASVWSNVDLVASSVLLAGAPCH